MSWVLRRWLNSSVEDKPTAVPSPPTPTPPANNHTTTTTTPTTTTTTPPPQSQQVIPNNLKLLLGGLIFFSLSTLVTRRTLIRKHLASRPPFYTSSVYHNVKPNGALDAFEALNLATINTFSAAMILAGGTLCALDINSVEDARRRLRRRMGYAEYNNDGVGNDDKTKMVPPTKEEEEQFERDMETWLANVLGKKDMEEVRRKVEVAKAAAAAAQAEEGRSK